MFKQVGKHIEYMRQKSSKNILVNYISTKCLHIFFLFFSSPDEILFLWKRPSSKRHFTIDMYDFISGWNCTRKHPLTVLDRPWQKDQAHNNFRKVRAIKTSEKFTRKQLWWGIFLIKFNKFNLDTGFFLWN